MLFVVLGFEEGRFREPTSLGVQSPQRSFRLITHFRGLWTSSSTPATWFIQRVLWGWRGLATIVLVEVQAARKLVVRSGFIVAAWTPTGSFHFSHPSSSSQAARLGFAPQGMRLSCLYVFLLPGRICDFGLQASYPCGDMKSGYLEQKW